MMDTITTEDKLRCVQRELKLRNQHYPRWIQADRMSAGKAAHEIACMSAIADDYRATAEKDRLI